MEENLCLTMSMRCLILVLMVSGVYLDYAPHHQRQSSSENKNFSSRFKFDLKMPGASPHKPEQYICTYRKLPAKQTLYIVKYEPHASQKTAHHILIYGCKGVYSHQKKWSCGGAVCQGPVQKILFAWAKDAPALSLPKGVGFKVGGDTGINYIVMQIHYARTLKVGEYDYSGITLHMTNHKPKHLASIYVFASDDAAIPAKANGYHADMICKYKRASDMIPFAFRTHAHGLGRVISAYRVRDGKWSLIGIGNPQLPQAFYPVKPENKMKIHNGDYLAARCTYDAPNRKTTTYIGGTSHDEMCNFYMMYYSIHNHRSRRHLEEYFISNDDDGGENEEDNECVGLAAKLKFPSASDKLPPELKIKGPRHANHGMGDVGDDKDTDGDNDIGNDDNGNDIADKIESRVSAQRLSNGQNIPIDDPKAGDTEISEDNQIIEGLLPTDI